MSRKIFIVDPHNEGLYRALCSALANEPDVTILYDRRNGGSGVARWTGTERRAASDVAERIRNEGFAVIRPALPSAANVRWA
jgi:hypothetical protein